ncbi:GIY-YIG nuclease family protein [Chloroflexota bacterium]
MEVFSLPEQKINWSGISGKTYQYWIHELGTIFKEVAGNYIFARETEPGRFKPIYIGQTANLGERFENHHKMPCIRQNLATYICTHISSDDEAIRCAKERDLIQKWSPTCNS